MVLSFWAHLFFVIFVWMVLAVSGGWDSFGELWFFLIKMVDFFWLDVVFPGCCLSSSWTWLFLASILDLLFLLVHVFRYLSFGWCPYLSLWLSFALQ